MGEAWLCELEPAHRCRLRAKDALGARQAPIRNG